MLLASVESIFGKFSFSRIFSFHQVSFHRSIALRLAAKRRRRGLVREGSLWEPYASSHGEMHFRLAPEATLSRDPPTRPNEGRPRRPLNVESMIYRRLYPRSTVICLPCQFVKGNLPRVQSVYNELSSSRRV